MKSERIKLIENAEEFRAVVSGFVLGDNNAQLTDLKSIGIYTMQKLGSGSGWQDEREIPPAEEYVNDNLDSRSFFDNQDEDKLLQLRAGLLLYLHSPDYYPDYKNWRESSENKAVDSDLVAKKEELGEVFDHLYPMLIEQSNIIIDLMLIAPFGYGNEVSDESAELNTWRSNMLSDRMSKVPKEFAFFFSKIDDTDSYEQLYSEYQNVLDSAKVKLRFLYLLAILFKQNENQKNKLFNMVSVFNNPSYIYSQIVLPSVAHLSSSTEILISSYFDQRKRYGKQNTLNVFPTEPISHNWIDEYLIHDFEKVRKPLAYKNKDLRAFCFLMSNLKDSSFTATNLSGCDFRKTHLFRAKFIKSNLTNTDFSNVKFEGVNFSGSDLSNANFGIQRNEINHKDWDVNNNFSGTLCQNTDFSNRYLSACDFSLANLRGALFINVKIYVIDFKGANLSQLKISLSPGYKDISKIMVDKTTILPNGQFCELEGSFPFSQVFG